ncbi:hypothetical protein SDC9_60369 [bioreactor metagenome]|uniref:37-kD nucleoid-associated bacterial protein n=1 Tax=bioreactor metagenome TaxID=1076179 RepID=A0A644XD35_9ZZZZ
MSILFSSLYHINHELSSVDPIEFNNNNTDLLEYTQRLILDIKSNPNKRKFDFSSNNTEVRVNIDKFIDNDFDTASLSNANRLLRIEKLAQTNVDKLSIELQKGSFFQAVLAENGLFQIVLSKAEHKAFLDETDIKRHAGLPWEKKIFKAAIIEADSHHQIQSIFVFDTNPIMAKYWWRDFLELKERITDTVNTKNVFLTLERQIFNPLNIKAPADHILLKNSSLQYFLSNTEFNFSDFYQQVFEKYDPISPEYFELNIPERFEKIKKEKSFDTKFTIVKEEIKSKVRTKIRLSDDIELILLDAIDELRAVIRGGKELDGKKYIKIYSDTGYEVFKEKE